MSLSFTISLNLEFQEMELMPENVSTQSNINMSSVEILNNGNLGLPLKSSLICKFNTMTDLF